MTEKPFVHLHVHTEYSLLDGLSRIPKLVARAKELDMPALAITDHGTMFGVVDFFRAARGAGIKPIIGVEAYLARRTMYDRDPNQDNRPYHMLLLAKNQTGYQNLLKISSAAQLDGFYYRPRIDREFLAAHSEGLIATSGCLAAEIPRIVSDGNDDKAREVIGWYQDVFGAENFFLELQQHDIPELATMNRWLVDYRKSGHSAVQLLATNDVHYVLQSDHDPHDTLLCIQTSNLKSDVKRLRMSDPSYHLATQDEMWGYFHEVPEALYNTLKVAEMCAVDLGTQGYHLPVFPVPEGHDASSYLRRLCEKGLRWRFGDDADDPKIRERLAYELGIIRRMGFDTYFLIVWDLCEYARFADIWWNVRGSGAGSLAAYALGITNIDPLQNSLFFERFLNPGRVSMPDIDLDYPDDQREKMIAYAARKYGEDKVAAIITFGTLGAKAAVRDVGRVLDVDLNKVNKAASLIPTEAKQKPLMQYVESNPELHDLYKNDPQIQRIVDTARELQGVSRHASTHAAGIIIADKPLNEYIPLHRLTGKADENTALKVVTQFPMETCESIGLLKVDFLGLSTLTIMRKACKLIAAHHGIEYTMQNIPYRHEMVSEDEYPELDAVFDLIGRGETIGIFQVESAGMQQMLRGMRPRQFENIIAAISLYRPGPMDYIPTYNARMHGDEQVNFLHPRLEPILAGTYGIIVYQEQIMQIAGELFGYELGDADLMRKAVSKKKKRDLIKHKAIFKQRGPQHGVDEDTAERIFGDIEFFANYGFNRAHAADYAMITVQTAYLKTHYPEEYMAALLSAQRDDVAKVATSLEECNRLGIPILPPDVNYSALDFDIQEQPDGSRGIRFGLAAIKNAGVGPLQHIIEQREQTGPFESVEDFCRRLDLRLVQKRTLESLVKVGALASLGNRPQLLAACERMVSFSAEYHKAQDIGQMNLFGDADIGTELLENLPAMEEADQRTQLSWEKELLGFYITDHPLDAVMDALPPDVGLVRTHELKDPDNHFSEKQVRVLGLVASVRSFPTRNNEWMGVLQLEDRQGIIEVVLFPRTWQKFKDLVIEDHIILVSGKADNSRGDMQIICEQVTQNFDVLLASNAAPTDEYVPAWAGDEADWAPSADYHDDESDQPPPEAHFAPATHEAPAGPTAAPEPTNGHSEYPWLDEDEADTPPAPLAAPAESVEQTAQHWIMVSLERSGDDEKDRRRLHKLYHLLTSYPGNDRFTIAVVGAQQRPVSMEFPNDTTYYCDNLLQDLRRVVGEENITVELLATE